MTVEKLRPSFTFDQDHLDQLKAIAPEAFADGKINWDVLKEALGERIEEESAQAEHFGLFWPGKQEARRLASIPSKGTLVPAPSDGIDEETTRNVFVEGDNLEVLKALLKSYAGTISMIYIDPPYNTGNDFVYPDNFSDPLGTYYQVTGQKETDGTLLTTNPETSGRFHSNWLSMIYPRLRLARSLLNEDGVIFVSIDDREVHHLRLMMNEVFGEENFVADIVAVNNLKGRNDRKFIATAHERLLMFVNQSFVERGLALSDDRLEGYDEEDEGGKFRLLGLRKRGGADTRAQRPKLFFPLYVNPKDGTISLVAQKGWAEVKPTKSNGIDGAWRWGTKKVARDLDVLFGRPVGNEDRFDVFEKDYLQSNGATRRMKPKSVLFGSDFSTDAATKAFRLLMGETGFNNPKPVPFIKMLVDYSTDENDIVLDFFGGTCTTAHAVMEQNHEDGSNRRFIMVQLPEPTENKDYPTIAEIGKERIRRVSKKMKTEGAKGDLGFKVYKLERSSYKAWQDYHGEDVSEIESLFSRFESPLIEGWKSQDVLTEVMLIEGFPLDSKVTAQKEFKKNKVELVESPASAHRLFVCLDEKIADATIAQLSIGKDDVFVCLDAALTDESKLRLSDRCKLKVI